jgi:hypothetical protein
LVPEGEFRQPDREALASYFKERKEIMESESRTALAKTFSGVERAIQALSDAKNGAEYGILMELSNLVLSRKVIDPDFQKIANAIVVLALLANQLPPKRKGRPKNDTAGNGMKIASMYLSLVDSGVRYAEAVAEVADKFHKNERQIMRVVKEFKPFVGNTCEERETRRAVHRACWKHWESALAEGKKPVEAQMGEIYSEAAEKERERDLVAELVEMIEEVLVRRTQLT